MTLQTLSAHLRESETNPLLLAGPPSDKAGWVYRDFHPMPTALWFELLDLLGDENIEIAAANSRQLPPAPMCRAQMWISPVAQEKWAAYLKEKTP